ncbi:hypothetical protein LAZ67_3002206 [Cordylochernes scorpioides]|uniref:Uncharacterized protein n=1 Tax=Cordylochernes scorpioides TaxID=51811 RepID=A0ABY6KAZ4_9ARAC|nr:hypothetical protein LAZ67_3002206 [Cordylochernes scorpioides]
MGGKYKQETGFRGPVGSRSGRKDRRSEDHPGHNWCRDHLGSEWVSNIIVVAKRDSEEIRLCIDLREVNKAILRERHPIPTIGNMLHALKMLKYLQSWRQKKGFGRLT